MASKAHKNGVVLGDDETDRHYAEMAAELAAAKWEGDVAPGELGHAHVAEDDKFPFQVLGHADGLYYFLGVDSRTVVSFAPEQLTKNRLMSLAPLQFWERQYGGRDGIKWDLAVNAVLHKCHSVQVYDPSRVRGRGAWHENGKPVLHLGDHVVQGGVKTPIVKMRQGRHIYQLAAPMDVSYDNPLDAEEANQIIPLMEMLSWEKPISAYLLAGWCALAPIGGALEWRPHAWLTGPKGSGKSHIVDKIVRPLMGNLGLHVQSSTTEAGIRQTLGHDALAITFDEAESNSPKGADRIQMVLELMRQASSEGGSKIIKGSASGAARAYDIRSPFLMSSIGVGIKQAADASRVSVLSLVKRKDTAIFAKIKKLETSLLTQEYCKRFIARSIHRIPEIRENFLTFSHAAANVLGTQRAGDQIGALLAGWYTYYDDGLIGSRDAIKFIEEQDWDEQKQVEEDSDEDGLLSYLLAQVVEVEARVWRGKRSVGEIVAVGLGSAALDSFAAADAADILGRWGMRTMGGGLLGAGRLVVSNTHPGIAKLLAGTACAHNWMRIVGRIDGARREEAARFGSAHRSRGVSVPILEG